MPSTASETCYDFALRAIEEPEREVAGIRTRTGTLVAAAAITATVLAREVFAGAHPDGWVAWTATMVGLVALLVVLLASVDLLRSHNMSFSVDAADAYHQATRWFGTTDDHDPDEVHVALTYNLGDLQAANAATVKRLRKVFATALGGLVVETVGLGLGTALA
jgi:hypothetical protein